MKCFNMASESDLKMFKKMPQYDMNKLEVEYDYDTDKEQVTMSQSML